MYREVWEINNEIELILDIWPWLNLYIEIEWNSEEVVRKYSKILWFNCEEWVFGTSFKIYEKELWIDFATMDKLKEITFDNIPKK